MISYKEVTPAEISTALARIEEIKNTSKPSIDGRMLWCAANLVFLAGAKESEIRWFKVKNVFTGDDIVNPIKVCWKSIIKPIALSDRVKEILRDYIRHLQANKPDLDPDSPLFPEYFGRNSKRDFLTDLEEFSLKIKELRRIGAGNDYRTRIKNGIKQDTAERETAIQFRIDEKGGVGRGREQRIIFQTSKQSVIRGGVRKELKEQEKEEKRPAGSPERGISEGDISRYGKEREKRSAQGSSGNKIYGIIKKVDEVAKSVVIITKRDIFMKEKVESFLIEDTTKITKGNREIPLTELKEGMNVLISYRLQVTPYRMIATAINVYTPRGAK